MGDIEKEKKESLQQELGHIEQQSRMTLPGIQALIGFQFIAVFNEGFKTQLSEYEQRLHLLSLVFCVAATLFTVTPAAYHRLAEPGKISRRLVAIGTFCLTIAMFLLATAITFDIYLVARIVLDDENAARVISISTFSVFMMLWFLIPFSVRQMVHKEK
jgi:hypothetical protein